MIKRYRIIIEVDVDKLKKAVQDHKLSIIEGIKRELGWAEQAGITLEEIQEDI